MNSFKFQKILAIETSCDDTSVALVDMDGYVLGILNQASDKDHELHGGIVPEIASRNHTLFLLPLIESLLKNHNVTMGEIDGFVVTGRPGLIGALIVGLMTAKSLSLATQKPFIAVNHLEGHLIAPFLRDKEYQPKWTCDQSCIALAVSGGHSNIYLYKGLGNYEILGATKDDAAGEAFDKFGKLIGLGFPGGSKIDYQAKSGDPKKFQFPRSMMVSDNLDMSFSGLKSSAQRLIESLSPMERTRELNHLCASYQEAIVDVLIYKLRNALKKTKLKRFFITGGVSANSRLRSKAEELAKNMKCEFMIPPLRYCTDNAAMIGYAGIMRLNLGEASPLSLGPSPSSWPQDFTDKRTI